MDGTLWIEADDVRHAIRLGVSSQDLVEVPPAPPEGAADFRAVIGGVAYHGIPRGTPAYLKASGRVLAVGWQVGAGGWELVVNDDVVALTGSGSRQIAADDRLTVRFG